jgi:uncharacterized protein YkwD
MIKKLFMVAVLGTLALSACGGGATEAITPSATQPVVVTEMPVSLTLTTLTAVSTDASATATSGTPGSATPTLGTPFPTNPPDCKNSASFVADVTVPDNTDVAGGTTFTKTWRIKNTGTCVWGPTYTLVHYSDETLGAPAAVPLNVTYPNQDADISVDLKAPNSTGKHQGNFVIKNPGGLIMKIGDDSRLWAIINVTVINGTTVVTSPTATVTPLAATAASLATATNIVVSAATLPSTSVASVATVSSSATPSTANCLYSIDLKKLTEVIDAVNAYRAQNNKPAYTVNVKLAEAAQRQANDAACHKLYVHTGSDGSTPQTRVADTGYKAVSVSENINGNNPPFTGQEAVNWWINDKTDLRHGQNLLSTTFTEIGAGYSFFDNYGFYVLVFAKPAP